MNKEKNKKLEELLKNKTNKKFNYATCGALTGFGCLGTTQLASVLQTDTPTILTPLFEAYYGITPLLFGGIFACCGYVAGRQLGWAEKYLTRSGFSIKGLTNLAGFIAYFPIAGFLLGAGNAEPLLASIGLPLAYLGHYQSISFEEDKDVKESHHFHRKITEEREKREIGNKRIIREVFYKEE